METQWDAGSACHDENVLSTQTPSPQPATDQDAPALRALGLSEHAPRSVWSAGAQLGEGPLWSAHEQALYWVDILGQHLHRYTPATRQRDSWDMGELVSAVHLVQGDTRLALCLRYHIVLLDTASGQRTVLAHADDEPVSNRFNDAKVDPQGRLWCGSMDFDGRTPSGVLYRFDPRAGLQPQLRGMPVVNGPTWSLDGRTLYVSDSARGQVWAWEHDPASGRLGAGRCWLQLPAYDGVPDGMTTDAQGRIWVAHWGGACVTAHDPVSAAELARIALPVSQVTSCAFGGADYRTLFITSAHTGLGAVQREREVLAGALFALEMPVAGLPPVPMVLPA